MISILLLLTGLTFLLLLTIATSTPIEEHGNGQLQDDIPYANHIFNAIHSSMRQWGSSWNHNGMSLFLATVPANTECYLGLHESSGPVKGMNWLAFEPEHSLFFAGNGPPPHFGPHPPPPPHHDVHEENKRVVHNTQRPLHPPGGDDTRGPPFPFPHLLSDDREPGYLHTYRTKHPLSMLYIDGMSAAKSNIGPLDSQDYLLLNWTSESQSHGPMQEHRRAKELCDMAKYRWNSKIDGFIRMELGFEMILCDFEKHLDLISIIRPPTSKDVSPRTYRSDDQFAWYRAIAARFDGIGYDRVTLNYDDFTTAFDSPYNIFPSGPSSPPRLHNLSISDLTTLRHRIDDLILHSSAPTDPTTNWQSITDMIITRYSTALPYFTTLTNLATLQTEILMLMRPFIDFTSRNTTAELARCTTHFLPPLYSNPNPNSPASKAITTISAQICTVLLSTMSLSPTTPAKIYQSTLKNLTVYLDWTVWRQCETKCPYDEVCFIPIWPLGTVEDREYGKGRCVNQTGLGRGMRSGRSYWGRPGGPPGGPGGHWGRRPGRGGRGHGSIPRDGDGDGDRDERGRGLESGV